MEPVETHDLQSYSSSQPRGQSRSINLSGSRRSCSMLAALEVSQISHNDLRYERRVGRWAVIHGQNLPGDITSKNDLELRFLHLCM